MSGLKLFLVSVAGLISVALTGVAIIIVLWLCGYSTDHRQLTRGYYLDRDLNGAPIYYLYGPGHAPGDTMDGGGVFDGTVHKIGWNSHWLIAKVVRIYGGDPNGWYTLNFKTGQVAGPITKTQLQKDIKSWQIKVITPESLYDR